MFVTDYSKCQYPNLAAEIHASRYNLTAFAEGGNITVELPDWEG